MRAILIALLLLPAVSSFAQQVLQIRWYSLCTAPPVALSELSGGTAAMVRFGLSTFSEDTIVSTALLQGPSLGLTAPDAANLRGLFARYYERLSAAPLFKKAPSALPYCFSENRPAQGLASVYVPAHLTAKTKTILFLHGYGGSLLAYLHYLSTLYPNHLIICPAYGIISDKLPFTYLAEAQQAVAARLKFEIRKPFLIGLSAGAFGAARIYCAQPQAFSSLICLAAYAPSDIVNKFTKSMNVHFAAGAKESYVADGSFEKQMRGLKRLAPKLDWQTIPGAGHFFFLSHEQQTKQLLLRWEKP